MRRGFTLLELLASFAIVILLAGVSITYLRSGTARSILQTAGRAIAGDVRYTAQLSTTSQVNHQINFSAVTNSYTILALSTPSRVVKTVALPSVIRIVSTTLPQDRAEFNALGAAVSSGAVILENSNGLTLTIDIRPSGYVHLQ